MQKYLAPPSFSRTSDPRIATLVLSGALATAACGQQSAGTASNESRPVDVSVSNEVCEFGETIQQPDGSELYCAEMQFPSATVFEDYEHAALPYDKQILEGERVLVECVQSGPIEAAPSAHGNEPNDPHAYWYRIAQPEDWANGYTAANNFWNVEDKNIPFEQQPAIDPRIPACE
ncbi:MAG TPA: hypothetical protein VK978_00015 [Candidatus Saccharimonadales bacterium]|nr:hypothetical protein [Candidatus Saccharimonadales bacterium]